MSDCRGELDRFILSPPFGIVNDPQSAIRSNNNWPGVENVEKRRGDKSRFGTVVQNPKLNFREGGRKGVSIL